MTYFVPSAAFTVLLETFVTNAFGPLKPTGNYTTSFTGGQPLGTFAKTLPHPITASLSMTPYQELVQYLPSLTGSFTIYKMGDVHVSLGSLQGTFDGLLGGHAALDAVAPQFVWTSAGGLQTFAPSLPSMTGSFAATRSLLGDAAFSLPTIRGDFYASFGTVNDAFQHRLPRIRGDFSGYLTSVASSDPILPRLKSAFECQAGRMGVIEDELPSLRSSFAAYTISQATINGRFNNLRGSWRSF